MDHGNEFRGSRNGGKEVWVGLKWPENTKNPATQVGGRRRLRRPDPGESGGGWPENFTGVVVWSSYSSLSGACIVVVAGIGSHG